MFFFQPFDPFEIGTAMNERLVTNYAASKLQGAHRSIGAGAKSSTPPKKAIASAVN
jgi:hypothetical protein